MRGKNKIYNKLRRKQKNVVDAQVLKLKEKLRVEREAAEKEKKAATSGEKSGERPVKIDALQRFSSAKKK